MVKIDLTGNKYGRLTVLKLAVDERGKKKKWLCKCDCGNKVIVSGSNLRSGHSSQCKQCALAELAEKKIKHGGTKTKLYYVWRGMITRCGDKSARAYMRYGGRGICVCKEWQDFGKFRDWALSNGYSDGLEIDRVDNDGNYEPSNCRWVNKQRNANNKSNNRLLTYNGETLTMAEMARKYNVPYKLLHKRLMRGMPIDDALYSENYRPHEVEQMHKFENMSEEEAKELEVAGKEANKPDEEKSLFGEE